MTTPGYDCPLDTLKASDLESAVAERYGRVASAPTIKHGFPVGREFAEQVGYPAERLDWAPAIVVESFTGAGNPGPFVGAQPGDRVLDLGCGAGLDALCAAKAVGPSGSVIGLDFSKSMIDKAAQGAKESRLSNILFVCDSATDVPFDDDLFDLVTFNGILNLSPSKDAILHEIARVLKPGGRLVFAEIVLEQAIEGLSLDTLDDWFRCIGGAETTDALLERLSKCGLTDPQVLALERNARTGHEHSRCGVFTATLS